ncbi:MAG: bifunctional oligoribonuclease/PAP phosphatase NrnA, partial [Lachnospiraceae bacterium]|nr:bifunctional oligoribonuclease/PAP phosphatase NrnA [Lachnospiraceae bacterium]
TYFGGGGHVRAAGVTMKGTFHDIANNLSYHIEQQLKNV